MGKRGKDASFFIKAKPFHRVLEGVRAIQSYVTITCFIGMFIIALVLVFMRFVLRQPFVWGEEAARYLMVISLFLAISMGVKEKVHLNVEFFVSKLPPKMARAVLITTGFLTTLSYAFLSALAITFVGAVKTSNQTSAALKIPTWMLYCFIAAGFVLCVVESIFVFYNDFLKTGSAAAAEKGGGDRN